MRDFSRHPKVVGLAHELGLSRRGDSLSRIRALALDKVSEILKRYPVDSLESLLRLVAAQLSVDIEFIRSGADLERIRAEHAAQIPGLAQTLGDDFVEGDTEGLLLRRERPAPGEREYLALIDARGPRRWRAYFTAWHELSHRLVMPPQMLLPGVRRSPSKAEIQKDPLERVVDDVAGHLAFFEPFFRPIIEGCLDQGGQLTIEAMERAREAVGADASFQSLAIACLRLVAPDHCLVEVGLGLKKSEERRLKTLQETLPGVTVPVPKRELRLKHVAKGDDADEAGIRLFQNMRVPEASVLCTAFREGIEGTISGDEDMSWWESSGRGALPSVAVRVSAVQRGPYLYGLIGPAKSAPRD